MTSPTDLAVLLSGQVRSFVDFAVRDSWRAHLESLCAGASCTPHLFLCSDLGGCDAVARQPPATAAEWRAAVVDFSRGYRLAYENSSERCDHAEAMMRCSSEEERWCTGPGKPSCDADDAHGNSSTLDSRQAKFAGALAKFRSRTSAGRSVRAPRHQLGFARWRHCFDTRRRGGGDVGPPLRLGARLALDVGFRRAAAARDVGGARARRLLPVEPRDHERPLGADGPRARRRLHARSRSSAAAAAARLRFGTRRCSARSSSSPASRSARALCRGCCCGG